jgi:hypothetical protein
MCSYQRVYKEGEEDDGRVMGCVNVDGRGVWLDVIVRAR